MRTGQRALGLCTDYYVHVRGTVLDSVEGENASGGIVSAVEVEADEVQRVDARGSARAQGHSALCMP